MQKNAVRIFFITMALALLGFVGLGVMYLFGPGEPIDSDRENEEQLVDDSPVREELATGEEAYTLDAAREGLTLLNHELEPNLRVLTGSVMNNTSAVFAHVQIGFDLYDATDEKVASVGDSLSLMEPGQVWEFGLEVPPQENVARAELAFLRGDRAGE